MAEDELPFYAGGLDSFHRAADKELTAQVASLPLRNAAVVLDLACGDGYFARAIVRAFPDLRVLAADSLPAYRRLCEQRNGEAGLESRIEVRPIDATKIDLAAESVDAVFCAYSFQSIPQHAEVLSECRRVLVRGGILAVIERDGIHDWLLPLPTALELRIRDAELDASGQKGQVEGWTFSRRCGRLLRENGFELRQAHSFTIDRYAPFNGETLRWLNYEFEQIIARIKPAGEAGLLADATRYLMPDGEAAVVYDLDSFVSSIHTCFIATRG